MKAHNRRTGFTLIELLVVVGIIAMLASILMPSLSKAREQAKAASCLSNLHNVGLSLAMYLGDSRNYYPTAYNYIDGNGSSGGYYHWTAALDSKEYEADIIAHKYPKLAKQYVCPSHTVDGFAPTNFTTWRVPDPPPGQASQDATDTKDDRQAPRVSYVPNEVIMPRKKFSAAHDRAALGSTPVGAHTSNLCYVNADEVDSPNNTILVAEFSSSANCIWGSSVGGGVAYKSHRPTNAVKSDQTDGVFDGEGYETGTQVWKLTLAEAVAAIDAVLANKDAGPTSHHISYINPNSHGNAGSNYLFVDGHSSRHTLQESLDPGTYMWGKKVYSCIDKPLIQDNP